MNRRKFSAMLLCLGLAVCAARAGSAQEARPAAKNSHVFQEAKPVNPKATPNPEAFEFELNGFAYHIRQNGNGHRTKDAKTRGFNLRLDPGESVTRVLFTDFEGDLLLLLHTVGVGDGAGFVTRLEQPSMRGLWRQRISAPDAGTPLRTDKHLYVTGRGFVGKLDLQTGAYLWQHADLADGHGERPKPLGAFQEPELDGGAVLFRERPVYNPRRTLVVDKKSGTIVRVE